MMADEHSSSLQPVQLLNYDEKTVTFTDKIKKNPLFPLGITGFVGLAGYNIYKIVRNRSQKQTLPLSLQLIHTRMYAQGFVLGTLSFGVLYMLGSRIYSKVIHQEYKNPFSLDDDSKPK